MTPSGIKPATFRFVAQHLNHYATAVPTAKTKLSKSRVVLSGVLRVQDVSWRHIGAINNRYEWVAQMLGVTFVHSNRWVNDWDFVRDGLHINRREARHLGLLYSRDCGIGSGKQEVRSE